MKVGLGPGHKLYCGTQQPPTERGTAAPNFEIYNRRHMCYDVYSGQTAGWIKMPFGTQASAQATLVGNPALPPPLKRGHSRHQFLDHVCCGQTCGWIKMPCRYREIGLGAGHIVLDGYPGPPRKGHSTPPPLFGPCVFWPNGWMDQDASWYTDYRGMGSAQATLCFIWSPISLTPKGGTAAAHCSAHVYCGQTAGGIKILFDTEEGLGPGHIVLYGDSAAPGN